MEIYLNDALLFQNKENEIPPPPKKKRDSEIQTVAIRLKAHTFRQKKYGWLEFNLCLKYYTLFNHL